MTTFLSITTLLSLIRFNTAQSTTLCNVDNQCRGQTLNPPAPDQDFIVKCTGTSVCQGSVINVPADANLSVTCFSLYSCASAQINAPITGSLDIICNGAGACTGITINATSIETGSLTFRMLNKFGASGGGMEILCPGNNNNCSLFCVGCFMSKIVTQSDTARLDIVVSGTFGKAFRATEVYCNSGPNSCAITVTNGANLQHSHFYAVNGFDDFMFDCDASTDIDACFYASTPPRIHCSSDLGVNCAIGPRYARDEWDCIENNSSLICNDYVKKGYYGSTFNCLRPLKGGRTATYFDVFHVCESETLICNAGVECNVHCSGYGYPCTAATIYGPHNADLNVNCEGLNDGSVVSAGCEDMTIYGASNGALNVKCTKDRACYGDSQSVAIYANNETLSLALSVDGPDAFHNVDVYCPWEPNSCHINAIGNSSNAISDITDSNVYVLRGFHDLSISCESANSTQCVRDLHGLTMFCGTDYDSSCVVGAKSASSDDWDCQNSNFYSVCDVTRHPTLDPSLSPSRLTAHPTMHPSIDPTTSFAEAEAENEASITTTQSDTDQARDEVSTHSSNKNVTDSMMIALAIITAVATLCLLHLCSLVLKRLQTLAAMNQIVNENFAERRNDSDLEDSAHAKIEGAVDIQQPGMHHVEAEEDSDNDDELSMYNPHHENSTVTATVGPTTRTTSF